MERETHTERRDEREEEERDTVVERVNETVHQSKTGLVVSLSLLLSSFSLSLPLHSFQSSTPLSSQLMRAIPSFFWHRNGRQSCTMEMEKEREGEGTGGENG